MAKHMNRAVGVQQEPEHELVRLISTKNTVTLYSTHHSWPIPDSTCVVLDLGVLRGVHRGGGGGGGLGGSGEPPPPPPPPFKLMIFFFFTHKDGFFCCLLVYSISSTHTHILI